MGPRHAEAPQLVLDIGNTTTTMASFGEGSEPRIERVASSVFTDPTSAAAIFRKFSADHGPFHEAAICSVVPLVATRCAGAIAAVLGLPVLSIGSESRLPFTLRYENGSSFGADRLALCSWSSHLMPDMAHIAIDIGTAITFDVLDAGMRYVGGLILPGLDAMSAALHARTAQLPLVSVDRRTELLGRSTAECIRNGIFWGVVKQVEGLIVDISRYLRDELGEPEVGVIATGGNSRLIAAEIPSIDLVDELAVVRGSRLLLEMNPPVIRKNEKEGEVG